MTTFCISIYICVRLNKHIVQKLYIDISLPIVNFAPVSYNPLLERCEATSSQNTSTL